MTCASCANRVERRLNRPRGRDGDGNYATERAAVEFDPDAVAPEQLVAAVEAAGYEATLPGDAAERDADGRRRPAPAAPGHLGRAVAAAAAISMIPALQFDNWQWLALKLATPVVAVGRMAAPPGRVGEPPPRSRHDGHARLRRRARRLALVALRAVPGRRRARPACGWSCGSSRSPATSDEIYLETAAVVTTFILAGRWFEARAKRRAGGALSALLELGAKDVAVLGDDGAERRVAVERSPSATASSCAPARRSRPTASSRRARRRST